VHVDLADGLPALEADPDGRDQFVVFWWRDVALAHAELTPDQLAPHGLANVIAHLVAPAVGDLVFPTGFEGVDRTLPDLPREPAPDLAQLISLHDPLARADGSSGKERPKPAISSSVVICTRDRAEDLRRCLESIAAAAVAPDEVIVVDNAPWTGATREVVDDFPEFRYLAEERPGLAAARNTGVSEASREAVVFTDDDTVVHPDWLWRLLEGFDQTGVMAVTGLVLPAELETEAQVVFQQMFGGFNHGYRRMRFGRDFYEATKADAPPVWKIGAGANMAIRREAVDLVGGFDERLGAGAAGCSEDSELWYRLLAAGWECRYQPRSVVFHFHRRDRESLERQAHDYIRGHVAALFVQYANTGDRGNLKRALVDLPRSFARRGAAELAKRVFTKLGVASYPRAGTYGAEVTGFGRGLAHLPLAFGGPSPRHKAPLGPYLRQNPFPYPLTEGFFYREKMRAIHRIAPDLPIKEILEIGGGQSGLSALLYPKAFVTNADLDPEFASSPLNAGPRKRFVQADATKLPFPDESFDAVTMFDVLEHIPDHEAAASEALRVLRPGGYVLVTSPNENWRFPYYRALAPICPTDQDMIEEWGHVRRGYELEDLESLFGRTPSKTATFITPVTVIGHDIGFSKLPSRVRRSLAMGLSPLTWAGYRFHSPTARGTETASSWHKPE
jgi:GT2 family glycosyltransferase/SAM-dependent methyltransferase